MQLGVSLGIPYTLGKPAAAFSPLDLSPVLWLDASDTSTITESGGSVSQWDDKSGNGYHAVQPTAAAQPTTGTSTVNGLNVLDFVAGDGIKSTFSLSQPFVVFFVTEPDGNHTEFLFDETNLATRVLLNHRSGANTVTMSAGVSLTSGAVLSPATATLFRATYNSTSSSIFVDGSSVASGNAGTNNLDSSINIGAGWNLADNYVGAIAEIIFVGGTLTAGQIAATETYLADKWGITI